MSWTSGDVSGSQSLTSADHLYNTHINELRTSVDLLNALGLPSDSLIAHLAGNETITGQKIFNSGAFLDKGSQLFNVKAYGAVGNGVTDDTSAIQAAMNAAGASGGTVFFPPGSFLISSPLLWDKKTAGVGVNAPSFLGCGSGSSADKSLASVSSIVASNTFPTGEFFIDLLGPTATDTQIAGYTVGYLAFQGANRAAGIRAFNQVNGYWHDIMINHTATPNPADTSGSPGGAFNFLASPSFNGFRNVCERVFVYQCNQDAFYLHEASGSSVDAISCEAVSASRYGFNVGGMTYLYACEADVCQTNWFLSGAGQIMMVGCKEANAPSRNSIFISGAAFQEATISGCVFYGGGSTGGTEQNNAMIRLSGRPFAQFSGCTFEAGTTHLSDWVYLDSGLASGAVKFDGCRFVSGENSFNSLTNVTYNLNGNSASMLQFRGCHGINPIGTTTVAVPATGVATSALVADAHFYITAGTSTVACTVTNAAGTSQSVATIPANGFGTVMVPAGSTLTPTYTNSPTWIVHLN